MRFYNFTYLNSHELSTIYDSRHDFSIYYTGRKDLICTMQIKTIQSVLLLCNNIAILSETILQLGGNTQKYHSGFLNFRLVFYQCFFVTLILYGLTSTSSGVRDAK